MTDQKVSSLKTNSPFLLSANDNPGNLITQTQFKGPNYEEWAKAMRISLRAKKKQGFIDGTIKEPNQNSDEIDDWWTVNSMIVSWISNTIEPGLRSTISYKETAKELWDDIQQRFSVRNGVRVHQLKTEVANCKQNGDSIMAYYGRLKKLWDDLNDYDPMPTCSCNGCKCNFVTRLQQRQEEERVHQFLMGLDESSYSNVRSNIIASDPLPNLHRVYSQVTEQEQVQVMMRAAPNRSDPVSFAMKIVSLGPRNSGGTEKTME
ncbi:uncharacterized protein [Coffea arabica]|uniref:Retrotransposon Copia-like N-terminal domain-containing protein n=1 Tax=Coffea arabica TaxID=13443 RepID=A0ABM4UG06_COFAR